MSSFPTTNLAWPFWKRIPADWFLPSSLTTVHDCSVCTLDHPLIPGGTIVGFAIIGSGDGQRITLSWCVVLIGGDKESLSRKIRGS